MKRRYYSKILLVLVCIILSACTPPTAPTAEGTPTSEITPTAEQTRVTRITIGDGGFLSAEPCGPPCFLGIIPDETSYDEVIQILTDYQYLDYCKDWDSQEAGVRAIKCMGRFTIFFDQSKSYVTSLGIIPESEITIQDVIKKFGEPTYLNVIITGYDESTLAATIRIYYSDLKMELWLEDQKSDSYVLQPTAIVNNIRYNGEHEDDSFNWPWKQDWQGYIEYFEKQD